jgi:hypothetical protein
LSEKRGEGKGTRQTIYISTNRKPYKYVSTCINMSDRKHMKKTRKKRIKSLEKQIEKHKNKIKFEKGRKDTTKAYWQKEIDEKFEKQIEDDEDYMEEN